MPKIRTDALDASPSALVLVDFINPLRFEGADALAPTADLRGYSLRVPRDCVAAESDDARGPALAMARVLKAHTEPTTSDEPAG